MPDLRKCPFCGKEVDGGYPFLHYNELMGKWFFDHWCDMENPTTLWVSCQGETEQEVIDKWNGVYEEQESESL